MRPRDGAQARRAAMQPSIDARTAGVASRIGHVLPLLLYAAVTLVVVLRHEPWRDEADTWLYARDADLPTIFGRLRYMGTPGLWYLLVYPLAKLGLPYEAQALLHYGLAVAAAGVFYLLAPLPRLTKLLFMFSLFIGYEYVVVARSYVLTVLLLFLAAAAYERRILRPLTYALPVALLFHANAHSLGIAGVLGAGYAWDVMRRRPLGQAQLAALLGIVVSGAVAAALLAPPPDPNIEVASAPVPLAVPVSLGGAFLPWLDFRVASILAAAALAALVPVLLRYPQSLALLAGSFVWLLYVFVFRYSGSLRHHGLFLIVTIFAVWVARAGAGRAVTSVGAPRRELGLLPLTACLAYSVMVGAVHWRHEFAHPYSAAREMAIYLKSTGLTERSIAAHRPSHGEALLPYLPGVRLWYLGLGERGTYVLWNRAYRIADEMPFGEAVARFADMPPNSAGSLLLINEPVPEEFVDRFRLVYATRGEVFYHADEVYYLYEPAS